jgi:hypothetical protein
MPSSDHRRPAAPGRRPVADLGFPYLFPWSSATAAARDAWLERVRRDVSARLGPICAGMPAEAFDAMVTQIAERKLRWESLDAERPRHAAREPGA